jgi:sugar phosphate isomerase/epimerase
MFLSTAAAGLAAQVARARSQGMLFHLSCGSIGVKATQTEAIDHAAKYGFDAVDADARYLGGLSDGDMKRLVEDMKSKNVTWGTGGMPVDFRKDDAAFEESFKKFPETVTAFRRAGVERVTTWLTPCSADLPYVANFKIHARRLRLVAKMLEDNGMRFGLEYVGPRTSMVARRYPFIHTMAEMKELFAEIGTSNMGFVLDTWHWYTAGDTRAELLTLTPRQVVSVDLNDAPAGVPIDQQVDGKRELPAATGVIDVKTFLGALREIGYQGTVRVEPFNDAVRKMEPAAALAATKASLDKAFAQLG